MSPERWRAIGQPTLLIIFLTCALAHPARSQWQTFTKHDGLIHNSVKCILEDRAGNLWFGGGDVTGEETSDGGVSHFDGVNWSYFTVEDGLHYNDVGSMLQDRSGRFWFGGYRLGLSIFDGSSWQQLDGDDYGAGWGVNDLLEDSNGNVWVGTYNGVSRWDGQDWDHFNTEDGLEDSAVRCLFEDRTGNIWVGMDRGGVSRYNGSHFDITLNTDVGLVNDYVYSIMQDHSGSIWFGTATGVSRYSDTGLETPDTDNELEDKQVWCMLEDRDGNLWFGTSNGLTRFDGVRWETYTASDELVHNYVTSVLQDRRGNLWVGTLGGVNRFDGASWNTISGDYLPIPTAVTSLIQDEIGTLWVGTDGGGVSRIAGGSSKIFTGADGLPVGWITSLHEDEQGDIWAGTIAGVGWFDGEDSWIPLREADGLAHEDVRAIEEDRSGKLWFATRGGGASRYDGTDWTTFDQRNSGLAYDYLLSLIEDDADNLWFGTEGAGVSRYDGSNWITFDTESGLVDNVVLSICEAESGVYWFGTEGGVSRYDGLSWQSFGIPDLVDEWVQTIVEDRSGNLWFGTKGGVTRFDGLNWTSFTEADGLADNWVKAILEDDAGKYWFGTQGGLTTYVPDRVAPKTVILSPPQPTLAARDLSVTAVAAYDEIRGIEFSFSFGNGGWSQWTQSEPWAMSNLPDGDHVLGARTRDRLNNVDPEPAEWSFEIDATAPLPVITSPASGAAVSAQVEVLGTAADERFRDFVVEIRMVGDGQWARVGGDSQQIIDGVMAEIDSRNYPDGDYDLRLSVADTLGLVGIALTTIVIDNEEPRAAVTSPAKVTKADGGDVFTTNREAHLYFPPGAFLEDAVVHVVQLSPEGAPDTLTNGNEWLVPGYAIDWGGGPLQKTATLELACDDLDGDSPAVHTYREDSGWESIGGSPDQSARIISAPITEAGRYAIFPQSDGLSIGVPLSGLSLTPRVFSPRGTFANDRVAIGFTLERSGPVTVKIYDRAGRLVEKLVSGEAMNAGANLIYWNGRNRDGEIVEDGLYMVTVRASDRKETKTLAVVR
jgi:ligand-binding sensor domain-containing protein